MKEESNHEFGAGVLPELSTKLYRNPITGFREAVSNSLDAMFPYEREGVASRVQISTSREPDAAVVIEDWGTGIEDYETFRKISPGKKYVRNDVSSSDKVNQNIIGQKGMGKLSLLNLSSENKVEFFSNNERLGMHIEMTMEGFSTQYMNSELALPHHGLKILIRKAKRISESRLRETLSKTFALRIADGANIFVNDEQVYKPEGFDPKQFKLFDVDTGIPVYGNLRSVQEPKTNNIQIFVKRVFIEEKDFDFKTEGWICCDHLEPRTDRDGLYEGSELYMKFYKRLTEYLEANFPRISVNKDRPVKSGKQLEKMFFEVIKTIRYLDPNMDIPLMCGSTRDGQGIGSGTDLGEDPESNCTVHEGFIADPAKTAEQVTAKPIGNGEGHGHGGGESTARIIKGNGKILAPPGVLIASNKTVPQLTVVELASEGRPIVYFSPPNRLVINSSRPSSRIILEANTRDPIEMRSRVLPLLVRAGIEAFPRSSEMSKEEWLKFHDQILDNMWSK